MRKKVTTATTDRNSHSHHNNRSHHSNHNKTIPAAYRFLYAPPLWETTTSLAPPLCAP